MVKDNNFQNKYEETEENKSAFIKDEIKKERYARYWGKFRQYQNEKEQNIRFFNKNGKSRNIYDYVKDSVDRMNEHKIKPEWKEDWQNNVFDPITRDKLIAILSKMASTRMKPELLIWATSIFYSGNIEQKKSVFSDLLENANIHNQDEEQLVWEMYKAMSEGTVIGYEGWARDTREVEYVIDYNPDTGEKKTKKIKYDAWDDVFGEIVPIEEFFPETIWVSANEFKRKVHRVFRAREMTKAQFSDAYKNFPDYDKVESAGYYIDQTDFEWGIPQSVNQDNVFVLQYYDEVSDKMIIWANGQELYYGCLPFNHKRLPFWIAIFEPIHDQFLFGKSLPDKLMGMQDINNSVLNGMLDQLFIALNSPIFIDGEIDLEEGYLEPGKLIEISPGSRVQRGALGAIDPSALAMLQLIKRSMEESSVSAQSQGVPTGGRKTKYEVQQLQEGALNLAALFLQLMERAMSQKYLLRMYNILQYYSMPSRAKTGKKKFKFITVENRKLTNGKIGKRMLQIVGSKSEIPPPDKLRELSSREEGRPFDVLESKVEVIFLTRDYFLDRELELDVRMVPNSSVKDSEIQKQNKDIAFYQITANDPMVDREENLKSLARAFGKPESIIKKSGDNVMGINKGMPGVAGMKGQPAIQTEDIL